MIPGMHWFGAENTPHLDVSLGLAKFGHLPISHLADLFRLNVEILSDGLVLMLRVVNKLETFLVSPSFFFV